MLLLNDSDAVVKGSTYSPIELFGKWRYSYADPGASGNCIHSFTPCDDCLLAYDAGIALWVAGLGLEVIADAQKYEPTLRVMNCVTQRACAGRWGVKLMQPLCLACCRSQFKSNPKNADKWISSGVWK